MPDPNELLALGRSDLAVYATAAWPGFEFATHHRQIVEALEKLEAGTIARLIVVLPPRYGKSLLCSQIFPAWFLGKNPAKSAIVATYGAELSDDFGRRVRNLVGDPMQAAIFPECQLSADSASIRRFGTTAGGQFFAVGRGGPITGRGGDLLICDDLLKDLEEARSETIRRTVINWYSHVARTRLTPNGRIILIGTRWHENDLLGYVLRECPEENWTLLNFPAVAETDEKFRKAGEALWPERFPIAVLDGIRTAIGSRAWTCLYQGKPAGAEGVVFQREWMRFYATPPEKFLRVTQSWDLASKVSPENDYSVCSTWGAAENGYYLLSLWRGRCEFPELKRRFATLAGDWRPERILVEDASAGIALLQELKLATRFPVTAVKPDKSKELRAEAASALFESGRVFLPQDAPWLSGFIDELCTFPAAAHYDQVDSVTQALNYLRGEPEAWYRVGARVWTELGKPEGDVTVAALARLGDENQTDSLAAPASRALEVGQEQKLASGLPVFGDEKGPNGRAGKTFNPPKRAQPGPCPECGAALAIRGEFRACNVCGHSEREAIS
jgi:predicted phage terminase large subunit-like protein